MPAGHSWGSAWSIPAGGNAGWGQAEGRAPHLGSLLLKFLNGPFVDAPAFVDEVPGGGGFPRVHMPDDDDVDVRLLLPHAAGLRGAGRGGRRWGGRWERSCLLGEAAGEEAGASKEPPCASPLPALRERLSSPRPTFPLDHAAGGARPRLAALPELGQSQPAPGGGQPGYFGLPRPASKSQRDAVFFGILPSTALAETPSSQGYVIDASKVPFLPGKPPCDSGLLPLPSRSFQTRGHLLHVVGALGGAEGARPPGLPSPLPSWAQFG